MKKAFIFLSLIAALSGSALTLQAATSTLDYSGLVQCDGVQSPNEPERQKVCNFVELMNMINHIIRWIFGLTIPIFVIMIAYAGFLYMTPKPENRSKASSMLWTAVKGFVIMLVAWFIVSTLLDWLVSDSLQGASRALIGS